MKIGLGASRALLAGAASMALLVTGLGLAGPASAATCTLTENTDFTTAATLQTALTGVEGVSCSSDGDVITIQFLSDAVRGSSFAVTSMINHAGPADLVLQGAGITSTLDGGSSVAILYSGSASANVTIDQVTLTHAASSRGAGEVFGDLTITDSTVIDNTSTGYGFRVHGGGGSGVTAAHVSFMNNTAANGGAGVYVDLGPIDLDDTLFAGNNTTSSGRKGGAIHVYAGGGIIVNSVFQSNTQSGGGAAGGGALWFTANGGDVTVQIANTLFDGNTATGTSGGGAIKVSGSASTADVTNSTFYGNVTAGGGGGLSVGGAVNVNFSTFSENDATAAGQLSGQIGASIINATGNIFTSTIGESCIAATRSTSYNVANAGDNWCAGGATDVQASNADIALAALAIRGVSAIESMVPARTSPAIGLVPSTVAAALPLPVTDDQNGYPRNGDWYTAGAVQIDCPDDPTGVSATPGQGSAEIRFTAPVYTAGSAITNYEYSLDSGAWTALNPASTTSPFTIGGLTGGQTYSVRIRAVNADGFGASTAAVSVTPTSAGQAPTAVRNLRVTATDVARGTLKIAWALPSNAGSYPPDGYTVRMRMAPNQAYATAARPSGTTVTLRNMLHGHTYYIRVRAYNATGSSPSVLLKVRF